MVRGRVGGLLEAGAPFQMELNGYENIYLWGAWLGMTKREIRRNSEPPYWPATAFNCHCIQQVVAGAAI